MSGTFEALRLASGNTLIGGGTQQRLFEVTPEKETVWELTAAEVPELNLTWVTSLQILDNGNLVVANFLRGQEGRGAHAFEVTHDEREKDRLEVRRSRPGQVDHHGQGAGLTPLRRVGPAMIPASNSFSTGFFEI